MLLNTLTEFKVRHQPLVIIIKNNGDGMGNIKIKTSTQTWKHF